MYILRRAIDIIEELIEYVKLERRRREEYSILFRHIEEELHKIVEYLERLIKESRFLEHAFSNVLSKEFLNNVTRENIDYIIRLYKEFEIDEEELQKLMDGLKRLLRTEVKKIFQRLIDVREQLGLPPPLIGRPLDYVIEDVIGRNIPETPPKRERKEYGVLDLTGKSFTQEEIKKFVKKHKRGIIIMSQDMKEKILQVLSPPEIEIYYNTYSDGLTQRLILTFQWRY